MPSIQLWDVGVNGWNVCLGTKSLWDCVSFASVNTHLYLRLKQRNLEPMCSASNTLLHFKNIIKLMPFSYTTANYCCCYYFQFCFNQWIFYITADQAMPQEWTFSLVGAECCTVQMLFPSLDQHCQSTEGLLPFSCTIYAHI